MGRHLSGHCGRQADERCRCLASTGSHRYTGRGTQDWHLRVVARGGSVNKGVTISLVGGLALVLSAVVLSCGFLTASSGGRCNGGGACIGIDDATNPYYPLFVPIARVWGWEAAPFIVAYGSSLALTLGVALLIVANNGPTGVRKTGWLTLLIGLVLGVGLANVSGIAYPLAASLPLAPFCSIGGCSRPPPLFAPPVWQFVQNYPLLSLTLLGTGVVLAAIRFWLTFRRRSGVSASLVRWFQLAPVLAVTSIGLVALFRFPFPYPL
jgi:hypothetical protein